MSNLRDIAIVLSAFALGLYILPGLCTLGRKARRFLQATRRWRGGSAATTARCPRSLTPTEWIVRGQVARWDDAFVEHVKERLR